MHFSDVSSEKIKITRQGDGGCKIVAVPLSEVFWTLELGEPLPSPCPSSEALRVDQAHWGDRIRGKMRKIIGRSDLIMATLLKNKRLIGIRAVW